jgi:tetratricopeptide (TPR) repeat protein
MVIDVWFEADSVSKAEESDPLVHANLLNIAGLTDLAIAEFDRAEKRLLECLSIRSKHLGANEEPMVNINSNIGLAYGCQNDYRNSIRYLQKALDIVHSWDRPSPVKEVLVYTNMGKVHGVAGDFDASEDCLNIALQAAASLNSVFWITAYDQDRYMQTVHS